MRMSKLSATEVDIVKPLSRELLESEIQRVVVRTENASQDMASQTHAALLSRTPIYSSPSL